MTRCEGTLDVSSTRPESVTRIWDEHLSVANAVLSTLAADVARAADLAIQSLAQGGKLLAAGNGGSAADAQHIVAELTGRFLKERRALPAIALHTNTSALTAIGNDYGYDLVFARELSAHAKQGDVFVAISTSGNSKNILHAIDTARQYGVVVIGMTGASGGRMRAACDVCLCVPSTSTARIQEMHIMIGHTICQLVEEAVC
jgi:D-sedoheptulose 7-phosphate isomerase